MTPNEMDKLLTDLMAEDMNSVGFKKKKTGSFFRIINNSDLYKNAIRELLKAKRVIAVIRKDSYPFLQLI